MAVTLLVQGDALLAGGRFHEALAVFGQQLKQQPTCIQARLGLAMSCLGAGDPFTAAAWLSDLLRIDAHHDVAAHQLAGLLMDQELHAQALPLYSGLYQRGARDRVTLLHLGFCLEQQGQIAQSAELYRQALAQESDFLEAHVDLAGVLWRLGDYEGSLVHAKRAVALSPDHPYAVRILGTAYLHLNDLAQAKWHLRRALALKPDLVPAKLDLALTLLLAGELEEGWRAYAQRWEDPRLQRPDFYTAELEWRGPLEQPLAGRRILVYGEQGHGDVIQFVRYLYRLLADGATVYAAVQPELVPLVETIPGVQCLTPSRHTVQIDFHVALLDLPMHYQTNLGNLVTQAPYLSAPQTSMAQWRERLRPWDGVLKVGIAWAGQSAHVNDLNRSMPLSELLPLFQIPGVQCFSLQKSRSARFTDCVAPEGGLIDLTDHWDDFSDSAAMVANMDLVISVCTAVAHLAGALGRPTWVMLPPNPDWRWLLERADSPWYPTVRLFRRDFGQARAGQVELVRVALDALRNSVQ